jgi:hypothetical protein
MSVTFDRVAGRHGQEWIVRMHHPEAVPDVAALIDWR